MNVLNDIGQLSMDEIEDIEKLTLRWLVQATLDFGIDSYDIFRYSPDSVKDVAEDITREIVDRLAGYNLTQRRRLLRAAFLMDFCRTGIIPMPCMVFGELEEMLRALVRIFEFE